MKRKGWIKIAILCMLVLLIGALTACELSDPSTDVLYHINDNAANELNKDKTTKDEAINKVTDSITNLRSYLDNEVVATTGYYMGMEFNIDTQNPQTLAGGNFRLKIQAHLYTYPYTDEDGNLIYKYYDKKDGKYYDENNELETRVLTSAEDIHNDVIRKSNILIEWYNGNTNEMLIGLYFDGLNSNSDDPGNILYLNIQGSKRSFLDFGDTVLYRQLIRLLMSLSVEGLLTAGNVQGDAGVSSLQSLFSVAVNDNYKVVLNSPVTSVLFYSIAADAIASNLTNFIQGIFAPFEDKVDPLTLKYLGFDFSVVGGAIINSVNSDMQFFTEPDPNNVKEIMTGAFLTFGGAALSKGEIFNYVSDVTFEYGAYPPEDMALDKLYYKVYDYGNYEFVGNLYIPMLNSNYDALIRTDMQQYDNSINNVFMEFTDIANGELMIGAYYKNERTYLDISGLEYLYGWIDLNALGFPKVYDESINLAELLGKMFNFLNNGIVSIVDAILSPDKNDKKNHLLEYIMEKTESTKKDPNDIFSKNTVTLTVDMYLIKHALEETGQGTYTTRQIINILDSLMPYTMDQIAIMLGVSSAEVMLDNTYFTFTLNVDTNEITVKMFTNVGVKQGEPSTLIFQLDVIPTHVGEYVDIAEVNFDGFNPLEQIYTYSATMNGNFVFSTAETVDMSKLLSATIGENSGKNTPYVLAQKAGLTFKLVYDQFVTDQYVDGVLKKAGRSAFELTLWLTGSETSVIIRLASDDVAFNNEVYQNQPERAKELGYVWVSIECVTDGSTQIIPKVKIREDVFMTSMQAYMNGTKISDNASELGDTDVNLSITSILFALVEDSYVVAEPKQLEITTSNETVQSLFRVKGLIGNIRVDAGFTYRVEGLENIKNDYGMYKVGQFTDIEGNSPYDTELHDTIPVYFYDDYHQDYDDLDYDLRVDVENGRIQIYEKGGKVSIYRETIEYSADSFFNTEDANNQDISLVRFKYSAVNTFVFSRNDEYYYIDYNGEEVPIEEQYVRMESGEIYIYYLGIKGRVHHESGAEYYYYDKEKAVVDANGDNVYYYAKTTRQFLFDYDERSIEITAAAKTQYAPRINGSFMGNIRRYILVMTSVLTVERGMLVELNSKDFYSVEDETNIVRVYDDEGILISEEVKPIVLFVMEPCEPLTESIAVNIRVGNNTEIYTLSAEFQIDWESVTLKGIMLVTEVIVAKGMMGEQSFPVRIIVTNREISAQGYVSVFTNDTDEITTSVPVVSTVNIDPYDYLMAKYEYFSNIDNFNPDQHSTDVNSSDYYVTQFKAKEREFVSEYFSKYTFGIIFDYMSSNLYADGVKSDYIATNYTNNGANGFEKYNWNFDLYENGSYLESDITATDGKNIYMHTYFKGQLIALHIVVGVREFSHLKFDEDDDFDPDVENEGKTNNNDFVYGHYVANYFDEESYTISTAPIFVFKDKSGKTYEKVFDMRYISGINSDGNYIFTDSYQLRWGDAVITNIGSLGSYYYDEGVLVNRPFYVSHVVKDENGVIIGEETPTRGDSNNDSDIDTTNLNLFWLFKIYKPIRDNIGRYTGTYNELNLIEGTVTDNGFPTVYLRITVECPKLEVAEAKTEAGTIIVEADEKDKQSGNYVLFTPSAVEIGTNNSGYYLIDPLNTETSIIPRDITLYFYDPNDSAAKLSSHNFKNVEWYSYIPTTVDGAGNIIFGTGSMLNESGNQIIRYDADTEQYRFNLSTDEPLTTRIMTKIGSEVSGYQLVVLCVRVLSKDPQRVEFFTGTQTGAASYLSAIEKINVGVNYNELAKADAYSIYTYYVNTFAEFKIPTWIKAYFGTEGERMVAYNVTWEEINSDVAPVYVPNSMVTLKTIIGDGDVTITIYLVVIVENFSISEITLADSISSYYVKVGSVNSFEYIPIYELFSVNMTNKTIGLYRTEDYIEYYPVLSTGNTLDDGVALGKLGLYSFDGEYVLKEQMYPYEFVNRLYGKLNISFNNSELVDYEEVTSYYTKVMQSSGLGNAIAVKIEDILEYSYSYDASTRSDKINIVYRYENPEDFLYYYLQLDEDDNFTVYPTSEMIENSKMTVNLQSLTAKLVHLKAAEEIREIEIDEITTESGTIDGNGSKINSIYTYANSVLTYYSPVDGTTEFSFVSIKLVDGRVMSHEELNYRLNYLEKHRRSGVVVGAIKNKITAINDIASIFNINDIVREANDKFSFTESTAYKVSLGTGRGAYDITLRIIFDGGLRVSVDSAANINIVIDPYTENGSATYGTNGFIMATNLSVSIKTTIQDNSGMLISYYYGDEFGAATTKLSDWYVMESTFPSLSVGSIITYVPQSVIYSSSSGDLKISALTAEGFRVLRTLMISGVSVETAKSFNSVGNGGLVIRDSTINIADIYNYMPVTTYFNGTAYLPKEISFLFGGKTITLNDVNWNIVPTWYNNSLPYLTYTGTEGTKRALAQAEILGWSSFENGVQVYHDRIPINLYISIADSTVTELPWNTTSLKLETLSLNNGADNIQCVYVDAFNDAGSGAISNETLILPNDILAQYNNGNKHTFRNVTYKFANQNISYIQYNREGIDIDAMSEMMGLNKSNFHKDHIDIEVNLGLSQILKLRFLFYDKTVSSVEAVISLDDSAIRTQISTALNSLGESENKKLKDSLNLIRIQQDVEKLIDRAKAIKNIVVIPSADVIEGYTSINAIKERLLSGWDSVMLIDEVDPYPVGEPYNADQCWNYVLPILNEYAEIHADEYAELLLKTIQSVAPSLRKQTLKKQLDYYVSSVYNDAYDAIISKYIQNELTIMFESELNSFTSDELSAAIYYKNKLEASFDVENVIDNIYRIRQMIEIGMFDIVADAVTLREMYKSIIVNAVSDAMALAKKESPMTNGIDTIVDNVLLIRLGISPAAGSQYSAIIYNIDYILDNAITQTKVSLRQTLKNRMLKDAMDFSLTFGTDDLVSQELVNIIPEVVEQAIISISGFKSNISAIRRNLASTVDISGMLDTIFTRSINNFVNNVYMESKIAMSIKRLQTLNESGNSYYYIDPYYDYLLVPNAFIANFDEATGGMSYYFEANWSDTVAVSYAGNGKDDLYGYTYAWYNYYNLDTNNENSFLNDIMADVTIGKISLTWEQIKTNFPSEYNTLIGVENLSKSFYPASDERENDVKYKELYFYYLAGKKLRTYNRAALSAQGLDYDIVLKLFDANKYDEITANLFNDNINDNQAIKLIVKVENRTLNQNQLVVLDNNGDEIDSVIITNPFTQTVNSLPNKINVNGELMDIIWKDVVITPSGNLSLKDHTIYGNIKNNRGQQVSMQLYVNKWNYIGVYGKTYQKTINALGEEVLEEIDVLLNPLNFYFNDYLENSAIDSYEVYFSVEAVTLDGNGEVNKTTTSNVKKTFYPTDSVLLQNTVYDTDMIAIKERNNYVMYWDTVAKANILNNHTSNIPGDVYIGNTIVGEINIKLLATQNAGIPTSAIYNYESILVNELKLVDVENTYNLYTDMEDKLYATNGQASVVMDVNGVYPVSGKVKLFEPNIHYNLDDLTVRFLWNKNYETAVARLKNFIASAYSDIEEAAREQYAVSILMDANNRSTAETSELLLKAQEYMANVYYGDTANANDKTYAVKNNSGEYTSFSERCIDDAEQLLMINEKYDFISNTARFKGGADGQKSMTVLIRVGNSDVIYRQNMLVKVIFSDYTPITYYKKDGSIYTQIATTSLGNMPSSLYMAVRMDYWDKEFDRSEYVSNGKTAPYDNISDYSYMLLHYSNKYTTNSIILNNETIGGVSYNLRLIEVTDIEYGPAANGTVKSTSFKIGEYTYQSNLINLMVA